MIFFPLTFMETVTQDILFGAEPHVAGVQNINIKKLPCMFKVKYIDLL